MKYFLRRIRARLWIIRNHGESLNRRAEIEQKLLDISRGKLPLPTRDECRKMALRLGVPS